MLQDQTKLNTLIARARQRPETISPPVLAKINHHLMQTGQEIIPLPWQVEPPPAQPSSDLQQLQQQYQQLCQQHAADPGSFGPEDHNKLYRLSCLIAHCNSAERMKGVRP